MLAWIPLFPLLGFLVNGFAYLFLQASSGRKALSARLSGGIATTAIFASFITALMLFANLLHLPVEERVIGQTILDWISIGTMRLPVGFSADELTAVFCLVITGVGTLIHIYSIGYMDHDESPAKFFAYLNLFCFAMLVLVLGASIPVTFFGWEGVGLCSYLLIGYWYQDGEKASAGKKAFIVNRVGDFGVLLAVFMLFQHFGTLDYAELKMLFASKYINGDVGADSWLLTGIGLLLFLGCTGKSAQIPLYVWLPDAMAGPTPVSALIHAATMVTSGIYLMTRMSFLYVLTPDALTVVAWVGALTAFWAATIAIAQYDIKKVLAYSTVSQLGYMFLACGVGAFGAGVFHVMTHAFFKALLFLAAGSVIHGMHEEQDIRHMGGLRSKMPRTFMVFLVGWVAISGVPPFAGFFSKDEILWVAMSSNLGGSFWLWLVGAVTAVMTAFYMTRLFVLTFLGTFRGHEDPKHPVHESPSVMTVPLMVLAALSALGGFLGFPHHSVLHHWLEPVMSEAGMRTDISESLEFVLMPISVILALGSMYSAFWLYKDLARAERLKERFSGLFKVLSNKWYVDELYEAVIVRPIYLISRTLWKWVDIQIIDRVVLGFGGVSRWTGSVLRATQTGSLQVYTMLFLVGLIITIGWMIYGLA